MANELEQKALASYLDRNHDLPRESLVLCFCLLLLDGLEQGQGQPVGHTDQLPNKLDYLLGTEGSTRRCGSGDRRLRATADVRGRDARGPRVLRAKCR